MALSTVLRNRRAVASLSVTMDLVCAEPYFAMCAAAASTPSTTRAAMMASRYSVRQSSSVARGNARIYFLHGFVAAHFTARI